MKKIKTLFKSNETFFSYLFKNAKIMLILDAFHLMTYNFFSLVRMYAPKFFIDEILYNRSLINGMLWIAFLCLCELFLTSRSRLYSKWKEKFLLAAKLEATKEAYRIFEHTYMSNMENSEKANVFHRGIDYAEKGGVALYSLISNIISVFLSTAVITIVSVQFEWWLWIVIVVTFLIKIYVAKICQKKNFVFQRDHTLLNRQIQYYSDVLKQKSNRQESSIYNTTNYFLNKLCHSKMYNFEEEKKHDYKLAKFSFFSTFLDRVVDFVCYAIIGIAMLSGEATLGDYALFFAAIERINTVLNGIQATMLMASQESVNVENYIEFLNECKSSSYQPSNLSIQNVASIDFENVSFRYYNQSIPAINNLTLHIHKGERISVVGINGAGKTTFIKLLMGLYAPEAGSIKINGIDMRTICIESYWQQIGVVFQDYNIYPVSISDNMAFDHEMSGDAIEYQLEKVGLIKKIEALPNKTESFVSQYYHRDGVDFSIGEKQRLAIARAFSKNAELYIFDEPSSALDAFSEEQLYKIINAIPDDKTVILISHRLASVSSTKRIILFDDGQIIADGTHKELLKNCKKYKKLYETQVNRYGNSMQE